MKNILFLFCFFYSNFLQGENLSQSYCELEEQDSFIKSSIKPYSVVLIDVDESYNKDWIYDIEKCGNYTAVYIILRANYESEKVKCNESKTDCVFDLTFFSNNYNTNIFFEEGEAKSQVEKILYLSVSDNGAWENKIYQCARDDYIYATGFYRITYLGGDNHAGYYESRSTAVDPARAEATYGLIGESCFDFGEKQNN